jgi:hypothetical protein
LNAYRSRIVSRGFVLKPVALNSYEIIYRPEVGGSEVPR